MKISMYFLFYIAMIMELLIFIVDRDTAEEELMKSYARFAESQARELHISGPRSVNVIKGETDTYPISVSGFWNKAERNALRVVMDAREYAPGIVVDTSMMYEHLELLPDTSGGFFLKISGDKVKKGIAEVTISAVLHRSLGSLPSQVQEIVAEGVPEQDWLSKTNRDSIVVRGNPLKIRIEVVEKGEKSLLRPWTID
jgi:hypothetical protein